MSKSTKVSLLFFLIFLVGVLGIISSVNKSLNRKTLVELPYSGTVIVATFPMVK